MKCPSCGSTQCQCKCSPYCPDAPRKLSSDPERHPIEPIIAPLVFELKRTGFLDPSWSCEGHNGPDGLLQKLPRVWFNCSSMVQVRLLANSLSCLRANKSLRHPWHLIVTFSDPDNPETTFSLEPNLAEGEKASLADLQSDIGTLVYALRSALRDEARSLQGALG
ncbi:MAG: hypothetical protein WAW96_13305 [Alphaproteobacteria bacterium]